MSNESQDKQISDTLAQALLDHTPRGLYLRAVRAEAAYERAHERLTRIDAAYQRAVQQTSDAPNTAALQQQVDQLQAALDLAQSRQTEAERRYESAVQGRQEMRDGLRREREARKSAEARERAKDEAIKYARNIADAFRAVHENRDNRFPTDEHCYRRVHTLMMELMAWDAALAQQPAEQPETLEAQGHKARGEPLADHPAKHMEKE